MKEVKKTYPVIATHEVDITNVNLARTKVAFKKARLLMIDTCKYDVDKSYDLIWLHNQVLEKIKCANGAKTIHLDNRCCTFSDCPELTFMMMFVNELKEG